MEEWRVADAKNKFSELMNNALAGSVQIVHRRDEAVVVLSQDEYKRLTGEKKTLKAHLLSIPPALSELDATRDVSSMRSVDLS